MQIGVDGCRFNSRIENVSHVIKSLFLLKKNPENISLVWWIIVYFMRVRRQHSVTRSEDICVILL